MRALLLVVLGAHACAAACLIQGTVVDSESGKPLAGAQVFAKPMGTPLRAAIIRAADSKGTFCFERLPSGDYQLVAVRSGYLDTLHGARSHTDRGTVFHVDGEAAIPPVMMKLLKGGSIGGTVLDPVGEPVEGAFVQIFRKIWNKGWDSEELSMSGTDDRGTFRFGRLPPGTYYLRADPRGKPGGRFLDAKGQPVPAHWTSTFYAGSPTFQHATPIPLKTGEDVDHLAVTLAEVAPRKLSGRLGGSLRMVGTDARMSLYPESGGRILVPIGKDGAFHYDGLEPQKYRVMVNSAEPFTELEIDLTGGDISWLVVEAKPSLEIHVTAEGLSELWARDGEKAIPGDHGGDTFLFRALAAGLYRLDGRGNGVYLKSLTIDGKAQADTLLDLRGGAPASIVAVLSRNVARVEGKLERTGELPITVVWMDEEKSHAGAVGDSVAVDPAGAFHVDSLAPGHYRLFAIEGFDADLWGSPELAAALREKSVVVELREGESRECTLRTISPQEWTMGLRKAGM